MNWQLYCSCDPTFFQEMTEEQVQLAEHCLTNETTICHLFHAAVTLFYVGLLFVALIQVAKFWVAVSDKFSLKIKLLYLTFITCCALRTVRYLMLRNSITAFSEELFHFLYYSPLVLAFTGVSILISTWSELYSLMTGKGFKGVARIMSVSVTCDIMVALGVLIALRVDTRFCPVPIFLGSIALGYLFVRNGVLQSCRNIKGAKHSPRAVCFPQVTSFTLLAAIGLIGIAGLAASIPLISMYSSKGLGLLRFLTLGAEVGLLGLLLFVLHWLSSLSKLRLPNTLTPAWLTSIFREKGTLDYTNSVEAIYGEETMTSGCHSAVRKLELTFQDRSDWVPKAIVFKVLTWDKSFWGKLKLAVRGSLPSAFETKEISYLRSYNIESKFYEEVGPEVHGLKLPRVYYNYNDKFNNCFGMVMEDVTHVEDSTLDNSVVTGQPLGFTFDESRVILGQLAKFHAWFWDHPDLHRYQTWDIGAYYTGNKRIEFKNQVETHWNRVMENFGEELALNDSTKNLGARLYKHRKVLNSIVEKSKLKTLIHGDFKISNLFIDHRKSLRNYSPSKNGTDSLDCSVYVIDWQWVGKGSCAVDVAYYLSTSTLPDAVNRRSIKKLVKVYHAILVDKGVKNYPFKTMWYEVQLSMLDFMSYVISCKWSSMRVDDFIKNQQLCKDGLHIRSLTHAQLLVKLSDEFLDALFPE